MRLSLFSTILFSLISLNVNAQESFTLCYDPYPPYTLGKTGAPTGGLKVQLTDAVFQEINGVEVDIVLLPWKQCQRQVELGAIDGILPLFKNEQRASYMVFSDNVFDQLSVFWYNKSKYPNGISWSTFADLKELKLGMLIGGFIDAEMEALFEGEKGIHRGKTVENLFQLLLKDRVDLVAIDEGVGRYILQQNDWQGRIRSAEKPIGIQESYFGFSKKSGISQYLPQVNKVIAELHKSGKINQIRESTDY